jgi:hypothetical protein
MRTRQNDRVERRNWMEREVRVQAPRKTRIFDLEVIYGIYPVEQDSPI